MKTKKYLSAFLLCLLVVLTASCSKSWRGYDNENLTSYISCGQLGSIEKSKITINDSDNRIDERIDSLLIANAEYIQTVKPFDETMIAILNGVAYVDGSVNDSLSYEGKTVYGSSTDGENPDEFRSLAEKIIGKCVGEEFTYEAIVTDGDENSMEVTYEATIVSVKKPTPPELTDEVAKNLVPDVNSVAELRAYLKTVIENELNEKADDEAIFEAWNAYLSSSELLSIPYEPYMTFFNLLEMPYISLAEAEGITFEEYVVNRCQTTVEEFESSLSEKAIEKLKNTLLIRQTAKNMKFSHSEEEILEYAENIAATSDGEFENGEDYIDYIGEDSVTDDYLFYKIIEAITK